MFEEQHVEPATATYPATLRGDAVLEGQTEIVPLSRMRQDDEIENFAGSGLFFGSSKIEKSTSEGFAMI